MPYALFVSYGARGTERTWEPTGIIYEDGALAGNYAKEENAYSARCSMNRRYKAVKISDNDPLQWREREQRKFDEGVYQRPPWYEHYGFSNSGMYEHVDPDNPTLIRFIANQEDGLGGRYTSMSPGRFLRQYVDSNPLLELVDKWCAQMGMDETTSKLMIARTADEIYNVYTSGPHSCMAYPKDHCTRNYIRGYHPVWAYGDSDIGVAYIERYGEITARCTVWPDKKIHGRIYGDRERLLERLKENDYVEDWQGFAGAKIQQIWTHKGELLLPYIDGDLGVEMDEDNPHLMVLSEKPTILAHSPYGIPEAASCQRCDAMDVHLTRYREDEDEEWEYICADGCKQPKVVEPEPEPTAIDWDSIRAIPFEPRARRNIPEEVCPWTAFTYNYEGTNE